MIKNTSAAAKGENDAVPDEVMRYSFAKNLRDMTIWGYKTSEYVGEEVLAVSARSRENISVVAILMNSQGAKIGPYNLFP